MQAKQRKAAFVQLGRVFGLLAQNVDWPGYDCGLSEAEYAEWQNLVERVYQHNGWFTADNVRKALGAWSANLTEEKLNRWLADYDIPDEPQNPKRVGIVMAGNIPMVGFHDLLSVLIAGHKAVVKLSSDDAQLITAAIKTLVHFEPEFADRISVVDRVKDIDAVIATGSNNSARYFDYYFSKYPHIIRRNRNSVAVVGEGASEDELKALGHDVFDYFGLGCRNVTKLLLPRGFDIDRFFNAIYPFHPIIDHNKYANNYDYHKALYLLNKEPLLDNGFILLREHAQLHSALGTLHYEFYDADDAVNSYLKQHQADIQCVVATNDRPESELAPGQTQQPELWDYADGVDTLKFLLER